MLVQTWRLEGASARHLKPGADHGAHNLSKVVVMDVAIRLHAVDALCDLILFQTWPADWSRVLLKLIGFASVSLAVGLGWAVRRLRRLG